MYLTVKSHMTINKYLIPFLAILLLSAQSFADDRSQLVEEICSVEQVFSQKAVDGRLMGIELNDALEETVEFLEAFETELEANHQIFGFSETIQNRISQIYLNFSEEQIQHPMFLPNGYSLCIAELSYRSKNELTEDEAFVDRVAHTLAVDLEKTLPQKDAEKNSQASAQCMLSVYRSKDHPAFAYFIKQVASGRSFTEANIATKERFADDEKLTDAFVSAAKDVQTCFVGNAVRV